MMSEHEKELADQEYDYRDPELQKMMKSGRNLINQLNTTTDIKQRIQLIYELFNHVGDNVTINGHFDAIYGSHISVGSDVFINGNCFFQDSNLISLGDRVIIAPDTKFYCGQHSLDATKRFGTRKDGSHYLVTTTAPITVGNDVCIGGNVTIIGGVTIGNNVIIGAGAVITKDVPDNTVVGGVPAHKIKELPALSGNQENHNKKSECWAVAKKGKHKPENKLWYLDAVEEVLCFGWIDTTHKRVNGVDMQRFTAPQNGVSGQN